MSTITTTNELETHDELENVPLVRMEDVQPDRTCEIYNSDSEVLETCIINNVEYEYEDEDSNIGSMISIKSEDVVTCDSDSAEFIVPEVLKPPTNIIVKKELFEIKYNPPESWPTLEILPGGVIKDADKFEEDSNKLSDNETEGHDMMYACAKCPQSFKYLFCLVKHVKWHEEQQKKNLEPLIIRRRKLNLSTLPSLEINPESMGSDEKEMFEEMKNAYETLYECGKCFENFGQIADLVKHMKSHKPIKYIEIKPQTKKDKKSINSHTKKRKQISKLKSKCKVKKS